MLGSIPHNFNSVTSLEVKSRGERPETKDSTFTRPAEIEIIEEFLAQVQFRRTAEIEGYSSTKISFTFVPYKLNKIDQKFTLFFENQDYTRPIQITIKGSCVDVPIYVEKEEYNLNILVYEQFYREKIVLFNRSPNSMKI